ncbi:MAG: hypothetical protein L6R40_003801 [Gallowayella cf. fulva]|nr:MAG: hypothetical protein L6R40_003801 [Xanthomendoza cf. fulva]
MCCWPFVDVVLEDPPPPPKVEEEKKEFHLVSDKPNLIGPAEPAPTYQPIYYAGQAVPEPSNVWYGSTKAEVDAQNAALAPSLGVFAPMKLVPANATAGQQFYCKELNGCYTLRTTTEIETSCLLKKDQGTSPCADCPLFQIVLTLKAGISIISTRDDLSCSIRIASQILATRP